MLDNVLFVLTLMFYVHMYITSPAPSPYPNQWCHIVNCTLTNTFHRIYKIRIFSYMEMTSAERRPLLHRLQCVSKDGIYIKDKISIPPYDNPPPPPDPPPPSPDPPPPPLVADNLMFVYFLLLISIKFSLTRNQSIFIPKYQFDIRLDALSIQC